MKRADTLFELIKSLDKQEKRYFILFVSRYTIKKNSDAVRLFNLLCPMKEYDEKRVREKYAGEGFAKHLPETKYQLRQLILKSLNYYHTGDTNDSKIWELLNCFDVLYSKNLIAQCKKILAKAKQIAEKREKFPLLIEIFQREKLFLEREQYIGKKEKDIDRFFGNFQKVISQMDNLGRYNYLRARVLLRFHLKYLQKSSEEWQHLRNTMNDPLLNKEEKCLSKEAQLEFNLINGIFRFHHRDWINAIQYYRKQVELLEESAEGIKENIHRYIAAYNNFLLILFNLNLHDDFYYHLQRFRTIPEKYGAGISIEMKVFCLSYSLETILYIVTGNFDKAAGLEKKIVAGLEKHTATMPAPQKFNLYYNLAYAHFGLCQYKNAAYWVNKILQRDASEEWVNYFGHAQLLNLIIHYELQSENLFESFVRSTYGFFYKRKMLFKFEGLVLNFIRKEMPKIDSQKRLIEAFSMLRKDLLELEKEPIEKESFENFDIISWLDSKIEKRPFAEIVREKAERLVG